MRLRTFLIGMCLLLWLEMSACGIIAVQQAGSKSTADSANTGVVDVNRASHSDSYRGENTSPMTIEILLSSKSCVIVRGSLNDGSGTTYCAFIPLSNQLRVEFATVRYQYMNNGEDKGWDVNGNGTVDSVDVRLLAHQVFVSPGSQPLATAGGSSGADTNCDDRFDLLESSIWDG